jgi:predicted nucleic acid-binding Zn ribbon protein
MSEPTRLRDLLDASSRKLGFPNAAEVGRVWQRWPEVVGPEVASHAEPTSLRDGVLRVRTDSPVWATEIGYLGPEIVHRVNGAAGRELVNEVRVWTGPPGPKSRKRKGASDGAAPVPAKSSKGDPDDPAGALDRARRAWRKRRGRTPSRVPAEHSENSENRR